MRALLLLHVAVFAFATPVSAAELALKRVMLSSAGVGYFEYEAAVDGPASLSLEVKLDQVDDVLKSLIVFDRSGGVGSVELPGRDESHAAFGNVPFDPAALASPLAFLNSLRGVEVTVQGPRPMQGRILRAETVHEPSPVRGLPGPIRTRVSLLTASGLKQFVLEDSDAVQVTDPTLRGNIESAVMASRQESARDSRRLTITSRGTGPRTVRVSYVAVAPLWKASYRLVLPAADGDTARLQGWATLENVTGTDWSNISLALQYGNPVTFHQAIYRSYFVTRPEVPVEVLGRLLPDVDTRSRAVALPAPSAMPAPPPGAAMMRMSHAAARRPEREPIAMAGAADATSVQEGATETVFTLPHPIDLAAGHSASVPILDVKVPAERISLAKPGQMHPLAMIRITNTSGSSLPAGVLTLYDTQSDAPYAGDARLGGLPVRETRLIAYAQDLGTSTDWTYDDAVTVASLTASRGVLEVDERHRQVIHVTLTAPAASPRHVLIEVPKQQGATVAPGFAQPAEQTDTAWRFAAELKPGETTVLTTAIDRHERRSIGILDDEDTVASVLNLQGASPQARAAFATIGQLRSKQAARAAELDRLKAQRQSVEADEARLRANFGVLQPSDALRTRLLGQMDQDETRHAQFDAAIDTATKAADAAHRALVDAVTGLRI